MIKVSGILPGLRPFRGQGPFPQSGFVAALGGSRHSGGSVSVPVSRTV